MKEAWNYWHEKVSYAIFNDNYNNDSGPYVDIITFSA